MNIDTEAQELVSPKAKWPTTACHRAKKRKMKVRRPIYSQTQTLMVDSSRDSYLKKMAKHTSQSYLNGRMEKYKRTEQV